MVAFEPANQKVSAVFGLVTVNVGAAMVKFTLLTSTTCVLVVQVARTRAVVVVGPVIVQVEAAAGRRRVRHGGGNQLPDGPAIAADLQPDGCARPEVIGPRDLPDRSDRPVDRGVRRRHGHGPVGIQNRRDALCPHDRRVDRCAQVCSERLVRLRGRVAEDRDGEGLARWRPPRSSAFPTWSCSHSRRAPSRWPWHTRPKQPDRSPATRSP